MQELGFKDHDYHGFWDLRPEIIGYLDPLGDIPDSKNLGSFVSLLEPLRAGRPFGYMQGQGFGCW